MTYLDLIAFDTVADMNELWVWAKYLSYVQQYFSMGHARFIAEYANDPTAIEAETVRMGNQVMHDVFLAQLQNRASRQVNR